MPTKFRTPGVYVEETAASRAIQGVATSIAAFVGRTRCGPVNTCTAVRSFAEFEQTFGGLWEKSALSFAVRDFFANGGQHALVVRLFHPAPAARPARSMRQARLPVLRTRLPRIPSSDTASSAGEGAPLELSDFDPPGGPEAKTGIYALEQAGLFNLLCIPPYRDDGDIDEALIPKAAAYCESRRAMLLIDPPSAWTDAASAISDFDRGWPGTRSHNAALYFPRLQQPDPLRNNQPGVFAPSGAVAGIIARNDLQRGVWKSPAGVEASFANDATPALSLAEADCGDLNCRGINSLRTLPGRGCTIWGGRTLQATDPEWRYIAVRRTALFIEESLRRGIEWAAFEPNAEPLWARLRQGIGDFLQGLFQKGAFQGQKPSHAFFVKCDRSTMTQNDIDNGQVCIELGFAPLRPAEFIILRICQKTGQTTRSS